jgi:hypothetical protein
MLGDVENIGKIKMDTKVSQENLKSDNLFSGVEWRMTFKKI